MRRSETNGEAVCPRCGDQSKHTNMVESFFSRLRNMIEGQHRGVRQSICTSMPTTRRGWKLTASQTTAHWCG